METAKEKALKHYENNRHLRDVAVSSAIDIALIEQKKRIKKWLKTTTHNPDEAFDEFYEEFEKVS